MKNMKEPSSPFSGIPGSIWALGSVSFLMKISSVLIFTLSPLYLTQVLGASTFIVGLLEGFLEAISLFTRIVAGVLSDYLHKRKSLIVVGYIFALVSRPLLALATTVGSVFLGRTFDRLGNGLDATPRDALVGDLAPPNMKGACYGLRESLARAGSFVGALLAMALLWITRNDYPLVFWIGSIPTLFALIVLLVFVKDPVSEKSHKTHQKNKINFKEISNLPRAFWLVLLLSGIYNISNFSGTFLILKAKQTGIDIHFIPLVMVIQNIATTLTAYPIGYLSDLVGRRLMMTLGIGLVIIANLLLANGDSTYLFFGGVLLLGAEMGITHSMLAVFLADSCPSSFRGTGFGLFHFLNGISLILANTIAGWAWDFAGSSSTFYASAVIAASSAFVLPFIHNAPKPSVAS